MSKRPIRSIEEAEVFFSTMKGYADRFEGFRVPTQINDLVLEAVNYVENGNNGAAADMLFRATRELKNNLSAFFRRSPLHFESKRQELIRRVNLDQDLQKELQKALGEEQTLAKIQVDPDLEKAAEAYAKAVATLKRVESVQAERDKKRRERDAAEKKAAQEAAEAKRREEVEAQRALEMQRRKAKADRLRSLIAA